MEIPHKIHYIWFGNNDKPEIVQKCIESWEKYFSDYEIIEWNESNYDTSKCAYIKEAYDAKKWAFASDYARFDILYKYGGIYFDTDVEILKKYPDYILNNIAFSGMESTGNLAPGLVFASIPGLPILKEILDNYEKDHFLERGKQNEKTVNCRVNEILQKKGFVPNNQFQTVAGLSIYPSVFFCGYDMDIREFDIREETVSIHHYACSWKKKGIKRAIQDTIKNRFGIDNYRKILKFKRKLFGIYSK